MRHLRKTGPAGFSVIDAQIVRDGARYVMFLKDETERPPQKNIRLAFADRAEGQTAISASSG